MVLAVLPALAAGETNATSEKVLLTGPMGELVAVPTNEVPHRLLPPAGKGLAHQLPDPQRGMPQPKAIGARTEVANQAQPGLSLFPVAQPRLQPYLAAQDLLGNTAFKPGALLPWGPAEGAVQQTKYWLSEQGFRYSLQQTVTFVNMTDVIQGDSALGFYTLSFQGKWAIFSAPESGNAGWISSQFGVKTGLGDNGSDQSPHANLGTLTAPSQIWNKVNGIRVQELAWQESFDRGRWVALLGMIDQGNYLDVNSYANSGRSQFMNSALVNSMVLPLPSYNFGANLQWQPSEHGYAMLGASAGNATAGQAPWTDFNFHNWSVLGEIGFTPSNFLGLGPGVYRIQPFVAQVPTTTQSSYTVTLPGTTNSTEVTFSSSEGGPIQGGLGFNFQQQLGEHSPFGWFGRFGFGGSQVSSGASAQAGTGFVTRGPLAYLGLVPSRKYDAAGVGFVWSQPSATSRTVAHENEFVLESSYVLRLTPFAALQPDLQVIWNPTFSSETARAFVFQLHLNVSW